MCIEIGKKWIYKAFQKKKRRERRTFEKEIFADGEIGFKEMNLVIIIFS
jgi:hypothetical protein